MTKKHNEDEKRKKELSRAFKEGQRTAKNEISRNKAMYTLLLEFIGYEDEWLTTKPGYKQYTNSQLIEIIFEQRALMKALYENVEESKKRDFKNKIEDFLWPNVFKE